MIRLFDIIFSLFLLILSFPLLLIIAFLIYLQDFDSPLYIAERVGKNFKIFKMIKFRSMKLNAEKSGVFSTSSGDIRITKLGLIIRKFKLDELPQLYNVLLGQMSFVGPRPNVLPEVKKYSNFEAKLLSVPPGITDISSIVFSDEAEILKDSVDPDLDYNLLIRPWKSRLGILYIKNKGLILNLKLIFLTIFAVIRKKTALDFINSILKNLNAEEDLISISLRKDNLKPIKDERFPI
jgi:lipopolysaccharide/colanic/teichoic acid biosynthesis glycosyltransferase